jgi:hypothetical protein
MSIIQSQASRRLPEISTEVIRCITGRTIAYVMHTRVDDQESRFILDYEQNGVTLFALSHVQVNQHA